MLVRCPAIASECLMIAAPPLGLRHPSASSGAAGVRHSPSRRVASSRAASSPLAPGVVAPNFAASGGFGLRSGARFCLRARRRLTIPPIRSFCGMRRSRRSCPRRRRGLRHLDGVSPHDEAENPGHEFRGPQSRSAAWHRRTGVIRARLRASASSWNSRSKAGRGPRIMSPRQTEQAAFGKVLNESPTSKA